ncbi:hypothetical protein J3B02_006227, partial [Coemansia erecta]
GDCSYRVVLLYNMSWQRGPLPATLLAQTAGTGRSSAAAVAQPVWMGASSAEQPLRPREPATRFQITLIRPKH